MRCVDQRWAPLKADCVRIIPDETDFNIRFRAPGRVVRSNGSTGQDGIVEWRFDPDDFTLIPKELSVLSVSTRAKILARYPKAKLDGETLNRLATTLASLPSEELASLAKAVANHDVPTIMKPWCESQSIAAMELVFALGIDQRCPKSEPSPTTDDAKGGAW